MKINIKNRRTLVDSLNVENFKVKGKNKDE